MARVEERGARARSFALTSPTGHATTNVRQRKAHHFRADDVGHHSRTPGMNLPGALVGLLRAGAALTLVPGVAAILWALLAALGDRAEAAIARGMTCGRAICWVVDLVGLVVLVAVVEVERSRQCPIDPGRNDSGPTSTLNLSGKKVRRTRRPRPVGFRTVAGRGRCRDPHSRRSTGRKSGVHHPVCYTRAQRITVLRLRMPVRSLSPGRAAAVR